MDWQLDSGALWTVVYERDELGNHLVPGNLTSMKQGGFYGWLILEYVTNGQPSSLPQDVPTGFLSDEGEAQGRPAGVAIDK